jgi:antitoxin CptB
MSQQADDIKRVYWHSRRGMLELDLILVPFVENCYAELSEEDQSCYCRLLTCEDTDMFAWFLKRQRPDDPELAAMVERIIAYSRDAGEQA